MSKSAGLKAQLFFIFAGVPRAMHRIEIRNNKHFDCDSNTTLFEGAKNAEIILEHSCLTGRCSSCKVKVLEGSVEETVPNTILTDQEKAEGFILSCICKPTSDCKLDVEDLEGIDLPVSKTVPAKVDEVNFLKDDVVQLILRMPPTANFRYLSGQYVNLIQGGIKRAYSVANAFVAGGKMEFFIKNYPGGLMSSYLFGKAKKEDLLRMEGPKGTFFMRKPKYDQLVFLATGTGIAPVKAMLEEMDRNAQDYRGIKVYVLWGARYEADLFWTPQYENIDLTYFPTLSRGDENWSGERGYIQEVLINQVKDISKSQVYACGSDQMIASAKAALFAGGLSEHDFYSDAFVSSN